MEGYPISLICQTLGIARSALYKRQKQSETEKEKRDHYLAEEAERIFNENRKEYGRTRLRKAMDEAGHKMSEGKVRRLMQMKNLRAKKSRKYKATTNSKHTYQVAENVLKRDFTAAKPNEKWCSDSTYIWTDEGWLYAVGILDMCDRSCVGLTFSKRHTKELMVKVVEEACREHRPKAGLIFHSDRGVQYASNDFKAVLKKRGMVQSMSRSGDPYDNAVMESFWDTVKTGCIFDERFRTRKEAAKVVYEYVFGFYNTRRYHSGIGLEVPNDYRKRMLHTA